MSFADTLRRLRVALKPPTVRSNCTTVLASDLHELLRQHDFSDAIARAVVSAQQRGLRPEKEVLRERFEAWCKTLPDYDGMESHQARPDGTYAWAWKQGQWEAYQAASEAMLAVNYWLVIDCPHTITDDEITLRRDVLRPGNALSQLGARLTSEGKA